MQLETGAVTEPNRRATEIALYDGLVARSQNAGRGCGFDLGALADRVAPLLPAGFYYKTFIRPRCGAAVGADAAAHGRARPRAAIARPVALRQDATRIATCWWWAAGRPGWRRRSRPDGAARGSSSPTAMPSSAASLLRRPHRRRRRRRLGRCDRRTRRDAGGPAVAANDGARPIRRQLVTRSSARRALGADAPPGCRGSGSGTSAPRQIVLATGALERPLVFPDNDRPGIMLAGAAETYAERYARGAGTARGRVHQQRRRLRAGRRSCRCGGGGRGDRRYARPSRAGGSRQRGPRGTGSIRATPSSPPPAGTGCAGSGSSPRR